MSEVEKITQMLEKLMKEIEDLKQRIEKLEKREEVKPAPRETLPPALLKTLKILLRETEVNAQDISKELNVSRSLAYNYLNELVRMGFVEKKPYLGKGKQRYVYILKRENLPKEIEEMLKSEE